MRRSIIIAGCMVLAACGGGGDAPPAGPNGVAASACEAYAKTRMEGKAYELDLATLGASMKPEADLQVLSGPIVIQPGTDGEVKQTLECKVRMGGDGKSADVISMTFL